MIQPPAFPTSGGARGSRGAPTPAAHHPASPPANLIVSCHRPRWLCRVVPSALPDLLVERGGFEPPKAKPADLQSAPFDRFGTSPFESRRDSTKTRNDPSAPALPATNRRRANCARSPDRLGFPYRPTGPHSLGPDPNFDVPESPIAPSRSPSRNVPRPRHLNPLQPAPLNRSRLPRILGAGDGTRTRNLLITNQLLYQLSYASVGTAGPELYVPRTLQATALSALFGCSDPGIFKPKSPGLAASVHRA